MTLQHLDYGTQLLALGSGVIVDLCVVLLLSRVVGIGNQPQPHVGREARRSERDQPIPPQLAGGDPVCGSQIGTWPERHSPVLPHGICLM